MYPKQVEEALFNIEIALEQEGLSINNDLDPHCTSEAIRTKLGPVILKEFIETGDTVINFETEEDAIKMVNGIIVESALLSLKKKGIVDSIENENGEEIYWLTKEGKEVAKKHKEENDL